MGFSTVVHSAGSYQNFEPDDTDKEFYIRTSIDLSDLFDRIKNKWPNYNPEDIVIEAENIHTDHLYYDLHDSGDYTNYLHITNNAL